MRLIAIDTSASVCAVGVAADAAAPVLVARDIGRGHAEALPGILDEAMATAGLAWTELQRVAVTVGPGSFTGVRIGVASARGLGLVIGCPVVGVTSLAVHAERARHRAGPRPVLSLIPARGDEFYDQAFAADGTAIGPAGITPATALVALAAGMALAGPGAPAIARLLPDGADRMIHADPAPDIAALLRLGAGAPLADAPPKPLYLKPPDAVPPADAVARR